MLRIGIIGAGRTVRMGHAPALTALPDMYEVVAIADRDAVARDDLGILLGVPPERRYVEYQDLLARESLAVVDIALPHALHYSAAIAALRAGCHIVTERPIALSYADAQELLRIAESRGKLVSVLHVYLHYPPFAEMVRVIRAGTIGQPFFIRCEGVTGGYGPGTESYHPPWHDDPALAGGGVWMDTGYHNAYLCAALMGSPARAVSGVVATFATGLRVDDTAAVLVRHGSGGVSSIQAAWSVPSGGTRVVEVYGTEGTLIADHAGHALGIFDNASRVWRHPEIAIGHAETFIGFFRALAACLLFGAPPPVTHREALEALRVVLAGYRAAELGTVESVEA